MEIANFFGNCAGVWDFYSDTMAADAKPSASEQFRNTGNGAQTAALWVLASAHALESGEATTYGSWTDLVAPKRESARVRMHALAEIGDFATIKAEGEMCTEALTEQENILQTMRKERVRALQQGK